MSIIGRISSTETGDQYESIRDLKKLKRVFHTTTRSLQEYADQEFDDPTALHQQDETLAQQRSLLETASNMPGTDIESVLLKFDLWMEDYAQSGGDLLSPESEEVLASIHQDLHTLAGE